MKKTKKVFSLLLCLCLVFSLVAIPTNVVAETTQSSYSILTFDNMNTGTKVNKGTVELPDGASLDGITDFSSGWNAYHNFDGSQEIVEIGGKKAWKINFDTAMAGLNNLCDVSNEFMIKIDIPTSYIPYVTGVKADITNASKNTLGISFGFTDGTNVSWNKGMGNSFEADYGSDKSSFIVERKIEDLWVRGDLYAACPTLTDKWTQGSAIAVYLVIVNKYCDGTEGGYILLNDIILDLSIPESQIPKEKDISLLDLSDTTTGSVTVGSNALPAGINGVSRWDVPGCGVSNMYSGKQEIVEVGGEKAWKINFNKPAQQNGWLWGSSGLMCFTVDIPSLYTPYISKINMEVVNNTAGELLYRFGVTDGSSFGTTNSGGPYVASKGNKKISLDMSALETHASAFDATHQVSSVGKWKDLGKSATKIYVIMSDSAAKENGTGYVTIKDITITCLTGIIPITAANVSGGTVVGNKIQIPVSTSDQVVAINVASGSFLEAGSITYTLSSTSKVSVPLKFYTNTVTDSGSEGYIKKGEDPWQYDIGAGETGYTSVLDFYGPSGGSTCVNVFEGGWYLNNWMGNTSNHPSATEKANITTIYLGVKGVSSPSGYITIDGLSYEDVGVKFSAVSVPKGLITVNDTIVPVGKKGTFTVVPSSGYYIKNLDIKSSAGETLPYEIVSESGKNGVLYAVTAPKADVVITPEYAVIDKAVVSNINYVKDNLIAEFTVPFKSSKVYNETKSKFETATDYGAYIAGTEALEKYGYTVEDLTPEFVKELFETGHHLSKYIFMMDSEKMITASKTNNAVKFVAVIEDVTIEQRRSPIILVTYAQFVDDTGAKSTTTCHFSDRTMDGLVYGPNLKEEFIANRGINFATSLKSDISVWQDIKSKGFDHVRIPAYLSDAADEYGNIKENALIGLDTAVNNALKCGYSVVIDVHQLPVNLIGNYGGTKDAFYRFWKQFAEHYRKLPLSVAFQFMNEPNTGVGVSTSNPDPINSSELMAVMDTLVRNSRAFVGNEDRYMVLSNNYNAAWALGDYTSNSYVLNHKNLILDIHYYDPMNFTHSGSTWDFNEDGSPKYPSGAMSYDSAGIKSTMANLKKIEQTYGVEVWLGEWGAFNPDRYAKINYYKEVSDAAEANDIAWCLWEYGGGWSPCVDGVWNQKLLDAIFN